MGKVEIDDLGWNNQKLVTNEQSQRAIVLIWGWVSQETSWLSPRQNRDRNGESNRTVQSINDDFTSWSRYSSHPGSPRIIRLSQIASFWKWPYIIAMEATHKDIKSSKTIIFYNCVNKRVFFREYQKYHVFVDVDDQLSGLVTVLVSLEFSVVPCD